MLCKGPTQCFSAGMAFGIADPAMKTPVLLLLAILLLPTAHAADWPQYLGQKGDGISSETINGDWKGKPPKTLWTAEVGKGCGSWAIVKGKAFVAGNDGRQDTIWCLNANTGKAIWRHHYPEKLSPNLYEGGPNTTPTIDGGRVYTLSKSGVLYCLNLADGRPIWRKHLKNDFGGKAGSWGYSASPVVDGALLYVLPGSKNGGFYALNKKDGSVAWHTRDVRRSGYSAPILTTIRGKNAALVFYGRSVVAHDLAAKGKVIFEFPWKTSYDVNASNPHYHDGKLFIASGYGMGYSVLEVSGAKPKIIHQDHDIRMIFQNSVRTGGTITGVFGDKRIDAELIRMDMASGKIHWRRKMPGTRGSSALIGNTFILLSETGDLIAGRVSNKGFTETGRQKILSRKCWSPFAVAEGKLFARNNKGSAICLDVSR